MTLNADSPRKRIEVVAAVIQNDGKILATQRGYGEYRGWWEFPGGKIEVGETLEDALIREIREELDCEIDIDSYIKRIEWDYPNFHVTLHFFKCNLLSKTIIIKEHLSYRWLDCQELNEVKWLPADKEIIELLQK